MDRPDSYEVLREVRDAAQVLGLRVRREVADPHVIEHPLAQGGHDGISLRGPDCPARTEDRDARARDAETVDQDPRRAALTVGSQRATTRPWDYREAV